MSERSHEHDTCLVLRFIPLRSIRRAPDAGLDRFEEKHVEKIKNLAAAAMFTPYHLLPIPSEALQIILQHFSTPDQPVISIKQISISAQILLFFSIQPDPIRMTWNWDAMLFFGRPK